MPSTLGGMEGQETVSRPASGLGLSPAGHWGLLVFSLFASPYASSLTVSFAVGSPISSAVFNMPLVPSCGLSPQRFAFCLQQCL